MRNGASIEMEAVEQHRLKAQEGCELTFEALFHAHQRAVYGWILRIVRNTAVAEDLTIETFWRIHRAHARYDPARAFEPWARRIATRVAFDWLRAQGPETAMPDEFFAATAAPIIGDPGVSAEIRRKVAQALGRLPPKLRIAATLALIEECPQKEIATALGISVGAVKLRVFRAIHSLRKDLQRQGITP